MVRLLLIFLCLSIAAIGQIGQPMLFKVTPPPVPSDLSHWYRPDGFITDGTGVTMWQDASGSGNNAVATTGSGLYATNMLNGHPAMGNDGSDRVFSVPQIENTGGVTLFIVMKRNSDPSPTEVKSGHPVSSVDQFIVNSHFPWVDGAIYESFGTTSRKSTGNPSFDLTNWFTYCITSEDGSYNQYINGNLTFSTASNTFFQTTAVFMLGQLAAPYKYMFDGWIAEVRVYNKVLTITERVLAETQLQNTYLHY